ncbi:hypothetical protein DF268_42250 [Streptomyces sp. V2]|nr:hypothetical protein DF268_42250 [Streptomyces sp. V2]
MGRAAPFRDAGLCLMSGCRRMGVTAHCGAAVTAWDASWTGRGAVSDVRLPLRGRDQPPRRGSRRLGRVLMGRAAPLQGCGAVLDVRLPPRGRDQPPRRRSRHPACCGSLAGEA